MKKKVFVLAGLLVWTGCNLLSSSPSAVVKKFMADAQKSDIDAMVKAWSKKAVEEQGADNIRHSAEKLADMLRSTRAAGEDLQVQNPRERIQDDRARVFFLYQDSKGRDSVGMGYALIREDGAWKIYRALDIGEEDQPFDSSSAPKKSPGTAPPPDTGTGPTEMVSPPPPPRSGSKGEEQKNSTPSTSPSPDKPISGGVLNGKATSLPQPDYPPIARAAKAGGSVTVQITFDEDGKVISAKAVSGHPLLRRAAEAAARQARFNPMRREGVPVKVSGVVIYQFSSP